MLKRLCPNTDLGSFETNPPNLNGLSFLELKLNNPSVLDLLSSVLENNELVFGDSADPPKVENGAGAENVLNIDAVEVTADF